MRWRDRVNRHLGQLLWDAARPGLTPDMLVLAIGLRDAVRDQSFRTAPQRLAARLRQHVVPPLLRLAATESTVVLLLDYPANRLRARAKYDLGAGAAVLAHNALLTQLLSPIPNLHIWTSHMPHVIKFYTDTCRRSNELEDPGTVHRCFNDTFHPGPKVVDQLLDQLLSVVC
ncbi:uncharacterized protein LOC119112798 [Pollicipes pollicipes]|uniref:uncharacterized protein LOC119112798 n=1 Tax=Pollicipes pollicipes TaxID=41117 RepID=UPI001885A304|nr:uncharacterized protein LOC119112798 [Pollicipes pollicipes]